MFEYNSFEQFGQEGQIRYRTAFLEFIRVEVGLLGRTTADLNTVGRKGCFNYVGDSRQEFVNTFRQEFGRKGIEVAGLDGHRFDNLLHV